MTSVNRNRTRVNVRACGSEADGLIVSCEETVIELLYFSNGVSRDNSWVKLAVILLSAASWTRLAPEETGMLSRLTWFGRVKHKGTVISRYRHTRYGHNHDTGTLFRCTNFPPPNRLLYRHWHTTIQAHKKAICACNEYWLDRPFGGDYWFKRRFQSRFRRPKTFSQQHGAAPLPGEWFSIETRHLSP